MDADAVVDRLVAVAPEYFVPGRGNCIVASRVGVEVLRYFGIPARTLPCEAYAYNPAAWRVMAYRDEPTVAGALVVARSTPPSGGTRRSEGGWWGHMVILLDSGETMLDLDLRQFRREAAGVVVPDAAAFAWSGEPPHAYALPAGGGIIYYPMPEDRTHRQGDWTPGRLVRAARPITAALIRRIRDEAA
jgi:hypothetical protein